MSSFELSLWGFVKKGHFALRTGFHTTSYIAKKAIYPYPNRLEWLGQVMADGASQFEAEVVVGPGTRSALLATMTARSLSLKYSREVLGLHAEAGSQGMILPDDYRSLVEGRRVLVVRDVLATGRSLLETITLLQNCGSEVVAAAVLVDRGLLIRRPDVPLVALMSFSEDTYPQANCPLCREGKPLDQI